MDTSQFRSRRKWGIIPDNATFGVFWWKVSGGIGRIFVEFLDKSEEKSFKDSMKGYGEILQYRNMTVADIEGELDGKRGTAPEVQTHSQRPAQTEQHLLRRGAEESVLPNSKDSKRSAKPTKHNLVLTAGQFKSGKQEEPWRCTQCGKAFKRHTNAETCQERENKK